MVAAIRPPHPVTDSPVNIDWSFRRIAISVKLVSSQRIVTLAYRDSRMVTENNRPFKITLSLVNGNSDVSVAMSQFVIVKDGLKLSKRVLFLTSVGDQIARILSRTTHLTNRDVQTELKSYIAKLEARLWKFHNPSSSKTPPTS